MVNRSRISGTGFYVPDKVVTNFDLEKMMDTSDEWIRERSGIIERRFVEPGVGTADLALEASKNALADAAIAPEELDFIIFATLSPDYYFPGSACLLQTKLGLKKIGALDVRTQCTGFIYGLSIADQYIKTGMYKKILVVGAEVHSNALDLSTRSRDISVLFGDGAGAVVLERKNDTNSGVLYSNMHSDGKRWEALNCQAYGSRYPADKMLADKKKIYMEIKGREVYQQAVRRIVEAVSECMEYCKMSLDDVKMVISHQMNARIIESAAKRLKLPDEKVFINIDEYGNTSSASVPIAFDECIRKGKIKRGDIVVFVAFGAGLTWGANVIQF